MYLVLEGFVGELADVIERARQAADLLPARSIRLIQALVREAIAASALSPALADQALLESERVEQSQETYAALDLFAAEALRGRRVPLSDDLRAMVRELDQRLRERQSDLERQYSGLRREPCCICRRHSEGEEACWRIGKSDDPEEMRLVWVHSDACETALENKVKRGDVRGKFLGSVGTLFKPKTGGL